jgi:peptidoglycan/LPS O-acetylase OafA/YrhL
LSILAVVAFHAYPEWITGGFVGVDVFFVISGFLISSIIFAGLDNGDFSFADFYARRARRIFPALILVLLASLVAGWFFLLPEEYKQLGKHVVASVAFAQNIALWKETGYFDSGIESKPIMHLWSLGIEEQFYLIFPFLVWGLWRFQFKPLILVVLLLVFSFGGNLQMLEADPAGAFFLPHTRFWELYSFSEQVKHYYSLLTHKPPTL